MRVIETHKTDCFFGDFIKKDLPVVFRSWNVLVFKQKDRFQIIVGVRVLQESIGSSVNCDRSIMPVSMKFYVPVTKLCISQTYLAAISLVTYSRDFQFPLLNDWN